jgi:phytoene dehydrogenase-like protein
LTKPRVVVIGAGVGGLAAAVRLARRGCAVKLVEARTTPGGLASAVKAGGFTFDGGPYILLDRPGLEWALGQLDPALVEQLRLRLVNDVYDVERPDAPTVRIRSSAEETAEGFESSWPGSGRTYRLFVARMTAIHERLRPLLYVSRPGPTQSGAWKDGAFLLRSLGSVFATSGLPVPVTDALAIWTHVAGQRPEEAPSLLAFVPALIHSGGAFRSADGMDALPRLLAQAAAEAGVEIEYGLGVRSVRVEDGRVTAVETGKGELAPVDAVVSNAGGLRTYLDLLGTALPSRVRRKLERLPLQSPGVCAYLAVRDSGRAPYLRFFLPGNGEPCRLLIRPAVLSNGTSDGTSDGWSVARLLSPLAHATAEAWGQAGQQDYLDRILAEPWWRTTVGEARVLARRTPADWGREFLLHRDSMNPVMTAHFMREGRLAHRSPWVRGLYLAGSSTHPGQWMSF